MAENFGGKCPQETKQRAKNSILSRTNEQAIKKTKIVSSKAQEKRNAEIQTRQL